jgi:iron complex outermembrane receptor protein
MGVSILALGAAAGVVSAQPAFAQALPVEQVIVTGTSIRGATPVGSNLITVGPADIERTGGQTMAQILIDVPAITGLGAAGQGENHGGLQYQPTIHQLGSSLNNTTLVLIDGHRAPAGSTNHSVVDPNILPTNIVQRVDVLADGSSATYGSEAIAGVINFITRKDFNGIQLNASSSFKGGSQDVTGGFLIGTSTEKSALIFAFQHTKEGELKNTSRPFTNPNQTARAAAEGLVGTGNTNNNTFNCDPAMIRPNATGTTIYFSGQSAANTTTAQLNAPCSTWRYGDLLQKEVRNNAMIKGSQDIGNNFNISGELLYATRRNDGPTAAGTLTATAFGPNNGGQTNPFYQTPVAGVTKEEIRWDATAVLGPAVTFTAADSMYGDLQAEYRLSDDFTLDFLALGARDDSQSGTYNALNASAATFALNGTANTGGSLTTQTVPGQSYIILNTPLTAANALDVWNPAATNRTSPAVIASLRDSANVLRKVFGLRQFRLSANATLFQLPAGSLKLAAGAEEIDTQLYQSQVSPTTLGAASIASRSTNILGESRENSAVFGELSIPIVSPEMAIPLVNKIDIDLAGRYDTYNDVGSTSNYKAAFNWDAVDGLRLRGTVSTSFVAPNLDVAGSKQFPGFYVGNTFTGVTNNIDVPVAAFPAVTQVGIAGCTAASVTCNISSIQGIQNRSGDANVQPIRGRTWSLGADYAPSYIPGLSSQVTMWNVTVLGAITGPSLANAVNNPGLNSLVTFTPGCATQAQITALQGAIPQSGPLPACALYLFRDPNSNYLNLRVQGLDISAEYQIPTDDWGTFRIGDTVSELLKFDEAFAVGAQGLYYSVVNTTGANTAFPSVQTQMRGHINWTFDAIDAVLSMNFTGGYRNWGTPVNPIVPNSHGSPVSGGDVVKANVTFDLHLGYQFSTPYSGADQITLDVRNLFDKQPPFFNTSIGYDSWVANPLGRVVQLGFKVKW